MGCIVRSSRWDSEGSEGIQEPGEVSCGDPGWSHFSAIKRG